jgi:hypothetical protein
VQIVFGLKLYQPCLSFWMSKNMVAQLIEWLRRRCVHTEVGRKKTCAATNCASSVEAKLEGFVIFKKHWSQMWLLCIL